MNVLVQGVGGIGGITSARLTAAGISVTPVTGNPAIAQALNTHGFRLEEPGEAPVIIPLNHRACATVPTDGDPYDVIILATQNTALEDAIRASRERLAPGGVVVCLPNGLPEDRAAAIVGPEQVVGAVVAWGASMPEPGRYLRTAVGGFQVGRLDGRHDEAVDRVLRLLEPVAPVQLTTNLAGVRWSKLGLNSAVSTLGAVGGETLGRLMRLRVVRRLALEVFTEVVAVARALDIRLEKVNGTFDLEKVVLEPTEREALMGSPSLFVKHSVLFAVGLKYRRMRSSMLYAIERGRSPAIEHLNGEVVRRGEALGIPTPVNAALVAQIHEIVAGRRRSSLSALRDVYRTTVRASKLRHAA